MKRTVPLTAIIYAIVVIVAATFFYLSETPFKGISSPNDIGPTIYPQILAIAVLGLIAIETVLARKRWARAPLRDLWLAFCVGCYLLAAIWAVRLWGYPVVLPIALFAALWLLGSKALIANAVYSVVFTGFIWLVFQYALGMPISHLGG